MPSRSRKLAIAVALATAGLPAAAHDWYGGLVDREGELCCGGEDCAPLPSPHLRRTAGGWDVDIVPGTHPMVRVEDWRQCYYGGAYCTRFIGMHTRRAVTFRFEGTPGISPDGGTHACIDGADLARRRIRCLFLGGVT
jgi:hypothetical protein